MPESCLDKLTFPELDFARPAADQIFDAVKVAILRMDLEPGCLISEAELGARCGASRTPVREAFTRLREEGLVVTRPSRGNFVSKLSPDRMKAAQFIREALELANVRWLCTVGLSDEIRMQLRQNLSAQARVVQVREEIGGRRAFQALDDRFHALLAQGTGFERAETLLVREKAALDRLRVLALNEEMHMTHLFSAHQAIFDAISARDSAAAEELMAAHLREVLTMLSNLVTAHRDYFE
ncbi:transcriptional regulator, GntR family [Epibacterium ulvae]|uniref:Transcriptional regulator, GntR family n=1 Tax=Epibacterium ulvae TaxID=1156985 RepID=A0A1G5RCK7_9RHOB|nr:GntR family transcriptional regulator [Epibacterium ulvae]SCZ71009.1 transcriptional regulator, GntR family [Epibacterium ulvae]